jgi:serine/threonine protein kinase
MAHAKFVERGRCGSSVRLAPVSDPHLAQARERLGHVLKDRWVLEDVLGVGGMAAVYAARHRNGARAAIKLLHGPLSEDQIVRERFLREAYLANSLDHMGTVHVLDDDADPKLGPFLVMELLDGQSLLELLDAGVTFDVPAVLDIAHQTLDVLAKAHEKGVVHRDLKPANLFLCRDGVVKVLDFGIARVLDASQARLTRTGVPLGTPAYMAPEQARGLGREADGRADIYALGATIFRLLAGRHVHVGRGAEQIAMVATARAPKLQTIAPKLPPQVCSVIDRALEFEPDRRYNDARAMQNDVRALQRGEPPPIASRPLPPPGPVPGLPPLSPRKRKDSGGPSLEDPRQDAVAEIAESHRQRAKEAARRPDAFTVAYDSEVSEEEEDDENMPTLVGSPREMIVGLRPLPLTEETARARRAAPLPRRSPAASPQRQGPPLTSAAAGQNVFGAAAAQAFARIPNVPVPQRPPLSGNFTAQPMPTERRLLAARPSPVIQDRDDVDLDAPTLARGDMNRILNLPASSEPIPPSSPLRSTQRQVYPQQQAAFSPPSIPPVPASQRIEERIERPEAPAPILIEQAEPRSRVQLLMILLAIVILATLIGLVAAKVR